MNSVLKYFHEPIGWDAHFAIPTFDFYFKFQLPKPIKERIILERDELGRILTSKVL